MNYAPRYGAFPFDPEIHAHFVFSAWCLGSGEPRNHLHEMLRHKVAKCMVREAGLVKVGPLQGKPACVAWAAVIAENPQEVVWAYTKARQCKLGMMTQLLTELGTNTTIPMLLSTRSGSGDAMARKLRERGWKILFDWEEKAA